MELELHRFNSTASLLGLASHDHHLTMMHTGVHTGVGLSWQMTVTTTYK